MKEQPIIAAKFELAADVRLRVGQQLRVEYNEVMGEKAPDRCTEILKKLDELQAQPSA
jgi:hypothetical protein